MLYRSMTAMCLLATQAAADVPNVVADIAPVHSLVARVMQGVGEPTMLMPQGASPHYHSMRPSEARALEQANLVVWIGEDLTPWLEDAVETLGANAHSLELLHLEGTKTFNFREDAVFGEHEDHDDHDDHGHDEDKHDDHHEDKDERDAHHDEDHHDDEHAKEDGHDDHHDDDHADHGDEHDDHHDEEEHAGHDDHDHHDHDGEDPHAWLSPENAVFWLSAITEELSELDPANAGTYAANATAGAAEIEAAADEIKHKLEPYHEANFVVFHDAYQYFENAFDLHVTGALHLGDAISPSAARLAEIQEEIAEHGVSCVFAEPQYNSSLVAAVAPEGTNTGILDPLGIDLQAGPSFYTALLNKMADSAIECLQ